MGSTSSASFPPYLRMSAKTADEATVLHVEGEIDVHRVFDELELTKMLRVMASIEAALDYLRRPITNDQPDRRRLTPLMAQGRTL